MNNCNHTFLIDSKTCKYCKITEKEFYEEQVAPFYQFNRIIEIKRELRTRFCPEKLIELYRLIEDIEPLMQKYENWLMSVKIARCLHEINPLTKSCFHCHLSESEVKNVTNNS